MDIVKSSHLYFSIVSDSAVMQLSKTVVVLFCEFGVGLVHINNRVDVPLSNLI